MYVIGPGHGGPRDRGEYLSGRVPIPNAILRSSAVRTASSGCSASFHGLTAFPAMSRRRRLAPFMRAVNWAIRYCMPMARRFDNPDLIVACVIGDGEAETGALSREFAFQTSLSIRPRDGAVASHPASQTASKSPIPTISGAHQPRRTNRPPQGLWLRAAFRRRQRNLT